MMLVRIRNHTSTLRMCGDFMVYFNLRLQPASILLAMTLRLAQKTWLKIAQSRGIFPIF